MKDNRIIDVMLKKHPELEPLYAKEHKILSSINKEMTPYLFFEYVLADALENALTTENYIFIKEIFDDIEMFCNEDYDYYSDVVITTIFENFEPEVIKDKLAGYFGKFLKSSLKRYLES